MTTYLPIQKAGLAAAMFGMLLQAISPLVTGVRAQESDRKVTESGDPNVVFEENRGQYDARVLFAGKGGGQTVFLTADEAAFVWPIPEPRSKAVDESRLMSGRPSDAPSPHKVYALKMKLDGANLKSEFAGEGLLEGKLHYFRGNDPSKWATNVPRYGRVLASEVYKGVGMSWYSREDGRLEYDFIVAPGADTGQIKLEFDGASEISIDATGDLVIDTPVGAVRHGKPVIYQETAGTKIPVAGSYQIADSKVGFSLGDYDRSKPLIIDPIPGPPVLFSTYLGGNGSESLASVKVDASYNVYVAGQSGSTNYPITSGVNNADSDACVTKLNPLGTAIIYSVLIGGSGGDYAASLALNSNGNAYIAGRTTSTNFPTSIFGYDKVFNGGTDDGFVAKLSTNGSSLSYSTYLGGSGADRANELVLDGESNAYITGSTQSTNFPTTAGAYDATLTGAQDPFVTKLNSSGAALVFSTYAGNFSDIDVGNSIAVDSLGRTYITGTGNYSLGKNGFVKKLNSAGSALVYNFEFGPSGDEEVHSIAIDTSGNAYVVGQTTSDDFPTTVFAFDTTYGTGNGANGFVCKINAAGNGFLYSSFLGGNNGESYATSIALDSTNAMFIVGRTMSASFPTTPYHDTTHNGQQDVFLIKIDAFSFATPDAATFLGGSGWDMGWGVAINSLGDAYVVGETQSTNFPTTPGVIDTTFGPGSTLVDGFVTRYNNYWLP